MSGSGAASLWVGWWGVHGCCPSWGLEFSFQSSKEAQRSLSTLLPAIREALITGSMPIITPFGRMREKPQLGEDPATGPERGMDNWYSLFFFPQGLSPFYKGLGLGQPGCVRGLGKCG